MTLGRGGGGFRTTILILLVAILLTTVVILVGRSGVGRRGAAGGVESPVLPSDSPAPAPAPDRGGTAPGADSAPGAEAAAGTDPAAGAEAASGTDTPPDAEATSGTDTAAGAHRERAEPLGFLLQGPRAARMERWQPHFAADLTERGVSARSTLLDAPVRVISPDDSQGVDAVAVRIAGGQWGELATGVTSAVPRIVWEPVERAVGNAGALRWIYAVAGSLHAEYLLHFENGHLLLRVYGTRESVDDVEIEALPRP